jgi:large subunit ribosomal protein L5
MAEAKAQVNAKAAEAAEKKKAKAAKAAEKKSGGESAPLPKGYVPRLKKIYREKVAPELFKEFSYQSAMQVPRFVKVIVSMGVGEAKENKKILDAAITDLDQIAGQHAVKTKARKSIATFKIRQGQEIGARVTLRGAMMWEFLDRLMNVALPRVKDFRGVNPNAFDGHGNYSLGLTEQIIFPEIDFDKIEKIMGLNIAIVTTARNDKEAKSLLAKMGMPFRK